MGKVPSSIAWILGYTFLDERTTENYISKALLLHVKRFFCEGVRKCNQWGDIKALFAHPWFLFTLFNQYSR